MRIYLDFDGCMHRVGRDKDMFEHSDAFASILRKYPTVEVVVSSSWREEFSLTQLRDFFADDVSQRIVDVTPVLRHATRYAEIAQHLRDTQFAGDYFVIDDDPGEFPTGWPPLLLCDPEQGFDFKKQDELRCMLSGLQKNVLLKLSVGAISLIEATSKLGLSDAGHTLRALANAGLKMPKLSAEVAQAQSAASLEALRSSIVVQNGGE